MTDKNEPLDDNDAQVDSEVDPKDDNSDGVENHRQDIFETTFERLMNGFGEACEKEGVEVGVAICKHPDFEEPFVFYRAPHIVDSATLMAKILRQIKSQIYEDLGTDPQ